jgi:hypothetical protein
MLLLAIASPAAAQSSEVETTGGVGAPADGGAGPTSDGAPADGSDEDDSVVEREALGAPVDPSSVGTQEVAQPAEEAADSADDSSDEGGLEISPFGMVEAFFLWSFRDPDNGIVAFRGFDNRHASFTLSNLVFGADFAYRDAYARIALQWGHTPASYYGAEPADLGGLGVGSTGPQLWQVIQEAYVGYRARLGSYEIPVEAGVFLSPVGNESLNIAGQWHFSRSNLFYGLPFYHSGARSRVEVGAFTLGVGVFNGINKIVDNNRNKSVIAHVGWGSERAHATLLYLGGHEQPHGTPGRAWRHLLDFAFDWTPTEVVSFRGQVDGGTEATVGDERYWWLAAALDVEARPASWLGLAARGDFFRDASPDGASPLYWAGAEWVSSVTTTARFTPTQGLDLYLEYRHDHAEADVFYEGDVTDPSVRSQDTLSVGVVGHL